MLDTAARSRLDPMGSRNWVKSAVAGSRVSVSLARSAKVINTQPGDGERPNPSTKQPLVLINYQHLQHFLSPIDK